MIETWFPRVGALALVLGAAFGFKYAVDRGFIGPPIRVLLGCLMGFALLLVGEVTRRRGWRPLAQAVTGGGIAMLYLTTWASWHLFDYLSAASACAILFVLGVAGLATSVRHNGQSLGVVAVLGAFGSPFATDLWQTSGASAYVYALLIDASVVAVVSIRPWRVLARVAFVATWFVLGAVYASDGATLLASSIAFAFFLSAPLIRAFVREDATTGEDAAYMVVNSLVFYLFVVGRLDADEPLGAAGLALVLSALHAGIAIIIGRRDPSNILVRGAAGTAIFFITLWLPLEFGLEHAPFLWAVEAAVAFVAGTRWTTEATAVGWLILGLSVLTHLGLGAGDIVPSFSREISRVAFAAEIAALVLIARLEDDAVAITGANALGLTWLSLETRAFVAERSVDPASNDVVFAITAVWALYAAALLVAGVILRSRTCRILSVALFGMTLVKMTMTDLWLLPELQRLVGFAGIGGLLIASSLMYHRFKAFLLEDPDARHDRARRAPT